MKIGKGFTSTAGAELLAPNFYRSATTAAQQAREGSLEGVTVGGITHEGEGAAFGPPVEPQVGVLFVEDEQLIDPLVLPVTGMVEAGDDGLELVQASVAKCCSQIGQTFVKGAAFTSTVVA